MRIAALVFLATALLCPASAPAQASANGDLQYWSQYSFRLYEKSRLSLGFYAEARVDDGVSDLSGVFLGPKVTYRAHRHLSLGLAVKRIDLDGAGELDGRVELELAPKAKLRGAWSFDSRHRIEILHLENRSDRTRFRHRFRFTRALQGGKPQGWSRLSISNELFHEDGEGLGEVVENRLVPVSGRWQLSPRSSIDVFFLIRSRKASDEWRHDSVIGTFWSVKR